jgi:hypothetical protein
VTPIVAETLGETPGELFLVALIEPLMAEVMVFDTIPEREVSGSQAWSWRRREWLSSRRADS